MKLVHSYLASRGLYLPPSCEDIRFHPNCPFRLTGGGTVYLPAMIALMRDILTNQECAVHRTALKPDGSGKATMPDGKSPKKMLGPAKGAAIKLCPDEEVTLGLGICEGIETGIAILNGGWGPVWACGSDNGIASFPVLPGIECLTIWSDTDPNRAGLNAAEECQKRWLAAGQECRIQAAPVLEMPDAA